MANTYPISLAIEQGAAAFEPVFAAVPLKDVNRTKTSTVRTGLLPLDEPWGIFTHTAIKATVKSSWDVESSERYLDPSLEMAMVLSPDVETDWRHEGTGYAVTVDYERPGVPYRETVRAGRFTDDQVRQLQPSTISLHHRPTKGSAKGVVGSYDDYVVEREGLKSDFETMPIGRTVAELIRREAAFLEQLGVPALIKALQTRKPGTARGDYIRSNGRLGSLPNIRAEAA